MAPKKASASGAKKSASKESSHPPYLDMIKEAVISLKERNGSSRQEIKKFIQANYKLESVPEAQFKVQVNRALQKGVDSGVLQQPKGPSGTVKLAKPDSKAPAKASTTKKEKAEKTESKSATKKAPAKKAASTKAKTTKKAAAPAKKASTKSKAKANTGKPRKTATSAPAVEEKPPVVLGKTKSGRVTKSSAPQTDKPATKKKAPAKKAATKKAATPKKA